MGQRRCQRSHFADPADMGQLRLQILQPMQSLLPLGEVADEAGEDAPLAEPGLADRELHREGAAVTVKPGRDPADADDLALPSGEIILEILIVPIAIWGRHQHLDVSPDDLCFSDSQTWFRPRR